MRLTVAVITLAGVACCLGGPKEEPTPPPPPQNTPSPLGQALGQMGLAGDGSSSVAAPAVAPDAGTAAPPVPPPSALPVAAGEAPANPLASTPACADAKAARELVRADLARLRMTIGADSSARLEAAGQAMGACNADPGCLSDGRARLARIEAYDKAKAAHEAELGRLAQAELGSYDADNAVRAACGAP